MQMFQPKYSLLDEWPDNRADEGMPIIRAIRSMSNHPHDFKPKLVRILDHDVDVQVQNSAKADGMRTIDYITFMLFTRYQDSVECLYWRR